MSIIVAILGLSFLIFFHELGHFLAAKACHVGVLEFSIGMGPRLISRVWRNTRYSIKLLPIGGSCAMLGEDSAGSGDFSTAEGKELLPDADDNVSASAFSLESVSDKRKPDAVNTKTLSCSDDSKALKSPYHSGGSESNEDPWIDYDGVRFRKSEIDKYSFQNKPALQRLLICAAGVINNFILAGIMAGFIVFFCGFDSNYLASQTGNTPAASAGFEEGDELRYLGFHGERLSFIPGHRDLSVWLFVNQGELSDSTVLDAVIRRNGEEKTISFKPYFDENLGTYKLGLNLYVGRYAPGNIYEFLTYTFYEVRYNMNIVFESLGLIIKGRVQRNEVMGPVGTVTVIGNTVDRSAEYGLFNAFIVLLELLVMLSSNLGIMNLLPIPALDGGRLLFILVEILSRKRPDPELEGRINQIGMIALLALMALIMSNDIWNIITGAYASMLGG